VPVLRSRWNFQRDFFISYQLISVATWDDPIIIKLPKEDFEGALFPPTDWQSSTLGIGWYASDNGSSANWIIPPGDGYYRNNTYGSNI